MSPPGRSGIGMIGRAGDDVDGRSTSVNLGGPVEGTARTGNLHAAAGLLPAGLLGGDVREVHGHFARANVHAADAVGGEVDAGILNAAIRFAVALLGVVLVRVQRGGGAVRGGVDDGVQDETGGHDVGEGMDVGLRGIAHDLDAKGDLLALRHVLATHDLLVQLGVVDPQLGQVIADLGALAALEGGDRPIGDLAELARQSRLGAGEDASVGGVTRRNPRQERVAAVLVGAELLRGAVHVLEGHGLAFADLRMLVRAAAEGDLDRGAVGAAIAEAVVARAQRCHGLCAVDVLDARDGDQLENRPA